MRRGRVKKIVLAILVVLVILLCPFARFKYKDGGTISYHAILWEYFDYHELTDEFDEEGKRVYNEKNVFHFFPNNFLK